jgi:hypothetical protein
MESKTLTAPGRRVVFHAAHERTFWLLEIGIMGSMGTILKASSGGDIFDFSYIGCRPFRLAIRFRLRLCPS